MATRGFKITKSGLPKAGYCLLNGIPAPRKAAANSRSIFEPDERTRLILAETAALARHRGI